MYYSDQPLGDDAVQSGGGDSRFISNAIPGDAWSPEGPSTYTRGLGIGPGVSDDLPFVVNTAYSSESEADGPLGAKWSHSYQLYAQELSNGDVLIRHGTGGASYFTPSGGGAHVPK